MSNTQYKKGEYLGFPFSVNPPGTCPAFTIGDGNGASEVADSFQPDGLACIEACQKRKESDSSINGVTIGVSGKHDKACYCEKQMTHPELGVINRDTHGKTIWNTCIFEGIRAFYFYKKV